MDVGDRVRVVLTHTIRAADLTDFARGGTNRPGSR